MVTSWVVDEMKTVNLKDKRLDARLCEVLGQLAARPTASIPAACGGRAEMEAAYRLFDNDQVCFDNILEPHQEATRRRLAAEPVVILAQDTTEIDLTRPEQQVVGAGPLDNGPRRGALVHVLHAFTPDGTPLGTLQAVPWARAEAPPRRQTLTQAERLATPLEDKESYRWLVALRQARAVAQRQPTTKIVCVADSEADIYEVLAEGMQEPHVADWIVRACQNRAVQDAHTEDPTAPYLREQLLAQPVLFRKTLRIRGRKAKVRCSKRGREQPRVSREAEVEVRAARVTLRPPRRPDRKLPPVSVNVVLVREANPPEGDVPVEWLLLTSLPIDTAEQVRQVIAYYCVRWMVEVFFRTLKSGCRAEERRFEHIDRQLRCLAVYLIVAWRTLYVCRLGRACPEISCEAIFEPAEWQSVYRVVQNEAPPPQPPSLAELVRMIAQLGGYVDRPHRDPPGPQTVWLGLQRMHDIAMCWELFGPGAAKAG
jgi:Transposase DNA-binding/Transposase Tn5 dimerisation domain